MTDHQTEKSQSFQIPNALVGSVDLSRLIRELEALDDFMYQSQIRTPGTAQHPPKTSRVLDELASANHCSLLEQKHRSSLLETLKYVESSAPVIHISFAVEPSPNFVLKVAAWVRLHIHQYLLIEVGLQPTIAVGCVVRTDNKIFDMSLRHRFAEFRHVLIEKIAENSAPGAKT